MKKYLISLILLISIFIGFNSVDAQEIVTSFDRNYSYSSYTVNIKYSNNVVTITKGTDVKTYTITKPYFIILWNNFHINLNEFDSSPIWSLNTSSTFASFFTSNNSSGNHNHKGFDYYLSNGSLTTYDSYSISTYAESYNCSNCGKLSKIISWNQIYSNTQILDSNNAIVMEPNIGMFSIPFQTQDYGNGQTGITTNHLQITSLNSSTIDCPLNTDFVDNYCNTGFYNYSTDDLLLNDRLGIRLYFNQSVPFKSLQYYILTFRLNEPVQLEPTNVTIGSGSTNRNAVLNKYKVYNNSYNDYQLVISPNSTDNDNNINIAVDYIDILFKKLDNYDIDASNFRFGVYNSYKYTDASNVMPTDQDLEREYTSNNINDISSGSSNNFFNNFAFNSHGISGIVTSPIRLLNSIINTNSCSPISFTFPHSNNSITIPCLQSYLSNNFGVLWTLLQFILSGIICYRVAVGILQTIKEVSNPATDIIEVVDL